MRDAGGRALADDDGSDIGVQSREYQSVSIRRSDREVVITVAFKIAGGHGRTIMISRTLDSGGFDALPDDAEMCVRALKVRQCDCGGRDPAPEKSPLDGV